MYPTEFDEQATDLPRALRNYWSAFAQYVAGEESMGVVDGYELAARNLGATDRDLDTKTVRRMVEMAIERGGSCWVGKMGGFYVCPANARPQELDAIRFFSVERNDHLDTDQP